MGKQKDQEAGKKAGLDRDGLDDAMADVRELQELHRLGLEDSTEIIEPVEALAPLALPSLNPKFLAMMAGTKTLRTGPDKTELYNLLQLTDDDLADWREEHRSANDYHDLEISKWLAWPGEMVDPTTGEVKRVIRLALILGDGSTLGCASEGIYRSLCEAEGIFGASPWAPPLKFKLREKRAKVGTLYKLLKVV